MDAWVNMCKSVISILLILVVGPLENNLHHQMGIKNHDRLGAFEEDLESCMSRGRDNTRDIFIRDAGADFLRGYIFEHEIVVLRFAEMTLRDRRGTSHDLASLFRGRRGALERWNGRIVKCIGTRP